MRIRSLVIRVVLAVLSVAALVSIVLLFVFGDPTVALPFATFVVGFLVSPAVTLLGEWARDKVFRPDIRALRTVSTVQAGVIVNRLLVKNEGSVRAREVEAVAAPEIAPSRPWPQLSSADAARSHGLTDRSPKGFDNGRQRLWLQPGVAPGHSLDIHVVVPGSGITPQQMAILPGIVHWCPARPRP